MNFMRTEVDAGPGDVVRATLDKQANLRLMDSDNL